MFNLFLVHVFSMFASSRGKVCSLFVSTTEIPSFMCLSEEVLQSNIYFAWLIFLDLCFQNFLKKYVLWLLISTRENWNYGWKLSSFLERKFFFLMSRNSKPFFNIVYFPIDITEAHYFTYRTQNVVSQMILDVFLGILVMTLLMQDGFTESISTQFFMWTEVHLKQ